MIKGEEKERKKEKKTWGVTVHLLFELA